MSIEELMKTFYSQPPGDEDEGDGGEDVEEGDDDKEEEKETPDDSAAQSSGMQEMFWPEFWLESSLVMSSCVKIVWKRTLIFTRLHLLPSRRF